MNAVDDISASENIKLFQDAREDQNQFNDFSHCKIHILGLDWTWNNFYPAIQAWQVTKTSKHKHTIQDSRFPKMHAPNISCFLPWQSNMISCFPIINLQTVEQRCYQIGRTVGAYKDMGTGRHIEGSSNCGQFCDIDGSYIFLFQHY